MSQPISEADKSNPFFLSLDVAFSASSNVFDLSGIIPFTIYVEFSRRRDQGRENPEAHSQPVDVITNGSLLDVSGALLAGLINLVEVQGRYPEVAWRDCIRHKLPKEPFTDAAYDPLSKPPQVVRLKSGFLATALDRQWIECSLDPAISSIFKDDVIYTMAYTWDAYPEHGTWNGGITWWKLCSDPALPPDISAPTDQPEARVRGSQLPRFKAMANPPKPPRIDYELEVLPAVISLSDPSAMKVKVKLCLRETTAYTVMWSKALLGPQTTALGSEDIGSPSFDVFDVDTGEMISSGPIIFTSHLWTAALPRTPIKREQLRELVPGQTYTGERVLDGGRDQLNTFLKYFRIADANTLLGRRLGVRLKPVQTFWSAKSIEELFEDKETIMRDYWYTPLTIESPAFAEFKVVP